LLQPEFVILKNPPSLRGVTDSDKDPLSSLLSSFALGPSWARAAGEGKDEKKKPFRGGDDRPPRRDDRPPRQGGGPRDRDGAGRKPFQRRDDRRDAPQRPPEVFPEQGVEVTILPDAEAVHLIGKEVHQVARVYPLFDVAKILLAEKARLRVVFSAPEPHAPLFRGKLEDSVFLTREEAAHHLWNSEKRQEFIEEETIEVDPPTGNFQAIARCGLSGEWLGPVNFHSYQTNLRRLHRERFARMPFEVYASKVRTERGEEAVNAWLETMKIKTRWRIKGDDDDAWMDDRTAAERALATRCFDSAFEETRSANVSGAIPDSHLSPSLLMSLKYAGTHARNHPAILIPAVCRAVEAEHLPVFKRQGKLHTGPARPHPLQPDAVLAERPGKMVAWIRENSPAKLEGLWQAVLPEGSTAPPSEYAADLFWLLHQGHILLFTNDLLMVQEARDSAVQNPPGEGKKKKKKKKSKKVSEGPTETSAPSTEASPSAAADAPTPEEPVPSTEAPESSDVPPTTPEPSPSETADAAGAAGPETTGSAPEPEVSSEPAPPSKTPVEAASDTPVPAESPSDTPEPSPSDAADAAGAAGPETTGSAPEPEASSEPAPSPETPVEATSETPVPTESPTPDSVSEAPAAEDEKPETTG
jgi:hypothetical protein